VPPGSVHESEEAQLLHDLSIRLYLSMQRDRGQTMAEYAVVLAVIAIGIFVALGSLRGAVGGALGKVTSDI
jgi:Flp pilus assembly pilin Flp